MPSRWRAISSSMRSPRSCFCTSLRDSTAVSESKPLNPAMLDARERGADYLVHRHHFRWPEALPWLIAIACFFAFPNRMTFGGQVLIMIMFALSLDLILGYAGIVTLGHAAFFGIGAYTVALASLRLGW